jgi:hypothetical protein
MNANTASLTARVVERHPSARKGIFSSHQRPALMGQRKPIHLRGVPAMKSEEVKQLTHEAIEELTTALNAGHTEELRRHLAAISRFHRYSLHNIMLITLQKPTATHVAGFHTWNKLGRHVRKGEKGIFILVPLLRKKELAETDTESADRVLFGFRDAPSLTTAKRKGRNFPVSGVSRVIRNTIKNGSHNL